MLTRKQVEDYILKRGAFCPFCRHSDIEGSSIDYADGEITQRVYCPGCARYWVDVYTLSGVIAEEPR